MIVNHKGISVDTESLEWIKSRFSDNSGGNCVEVALFADGAALRDSKDPDGGMLLFNREEWSAFIDGVKDGQLQ